MGHLCGYLKVDKGHPWHGKNSYDLEVSVHGGLSFASHDIPCDKDGPDTGFWVGFDCGHCFDAVEEKYMTKYQDYPEDLKKIIMDCFKDTFEGAEIRTADYVRNECEKLAIQANGATFSPEVGESYVENMMSIRGLHESYS
jgi:hypothetical protein